MVSIQSLLLITAVLTGAGPDPYQRAFDDNYPVAPEPTAEAPLPTPAPSRPRQPNALPQLATKSPAGTLAPPSKAATESPLPTLPNISLRTMAAAGGAVIGLFMLVAWSLRRRGPSASRWLPREVVEVLGRAPLDERGQLHLLRLGSKLVLVAVSPGHVSTVTEVDNPAEVERLTAACYQPNSRGPNTSLRKSRRLEPIFSGQATMSGKDRFEFAQLDQFDPNDEEGES
jgi:flagellar biogenesis protein FliO